MISPVPDKPVRLSAPVPPALAATETYLRTIATLATALREIKDVYDTGTFGHDVAHKALDDADHPELASDLATENDRLVAENRHHIAVVEKLHGKLATVDADRDRLLRGMEALALGVEYPAVFAAKVLEGGTAPGQIVPEVRLAPCPVEGHDGEHTQFRTGTEWLCWRVLEDMRAAQGHPSPLAAELAAVTGERNEVLDRTDRLEAEALARADNESDLRTEVDRLGTGITELADHYDSVASDWLPVPGLGDTDTLLRQSKHATLRRIAAALRKLVEP